MSHVTTCPRCEETRISRATTPDVLRQILAETGVPTGAPSHADAAFSICPQCVIDEAHIAMIDQRPLPAPLDWPVTSWHPMTMRMREIMDEEIARVTARRAA